MLKMISRIIALIYGISVGFFMVESAGSVSASSFLIVSIFWAWAVGPLFIFVLWITKSKSLLEKRILFGLQIIFCVFTLFAYYDGRYVHPDPQNGLLYLFVPLWSYCLISVIAIIRSSFKARLKEHQDSV